MSSISENDSTVLMSAWRQAYPGFQAIEYLYYADKWAAAVRDHPNWDHTRLNSYMVDVQKETQSDILQGVTPLYEGMKTAEEGLVKISEFLPEIKGIKPKDVAETIDWALKTFAWPTWDTANQVKSIDSKLDLKEQYWGHEIPILNAVFDAMSLDLNQRSEQTRSWRGFFLNFDITNQDGTPDLTVAGVIQNNPGLLPPGLQESVQPQADGTVLIDDATIDAAATQFFADFNTGMDNAVSQSLTTLHDISAQLQATSAVAMLTPPAGSIQQARQKAESNAASYATAVANAGGTWIDIVGTIVGFSDPKLGHEITAVGSAALKIGESITQFSKTVTALGAAAQFGDALASAVLTGNIVQAALSIISAFIDQGPSPEQMILDEVGKLRDQVNQLHQEMTERFDHIDQELNVIYTTVTAELNKINVTLGQIGDTIANIQQTLQVTLAAVHRIEADMTRYLQDNARVELLEAINGALGFKQRTGQDMTFDQYTTWENIFYTWAVTVSKDSTEADTGLATGDIDADANLADRSLDSNINYVNQLLAALGLPRFGDGSVLPNPRTYAQAARSLSLMQWENGPYAARIDPGRSQAVRAVGEQLRTSLASFASNGTAMVNGLLALYLAAAQQLRDQIEADRQSYLKKYLKDVVADYWTADPTVTDLDYAPAPVGSIVNRKTLPAPSNLRLLVPVQVLNYEWVADTDPAAGQPRQSPLQFRVDSNFTDKESTVISTIHGVISITTGIVAVTLTVQYPDLTGKLVTLWHRTVTGPRVDESAQPDPVAKYWLDPHEGNFKAQFESSTTSDPLPADQQAQRDDLIKNLSAKMVQTFADRRTVFSLQTVANLGNVPYSSCLARLSATSRLLQAVLQLGLPRATLFDDAMRLLAIGDAHLPRGDEVVSWWQEADGKQQIPTDDLITSFQQLKEILITRLAVFQNAQAGNQYVDDEPITKATVDFIDSATKFTELYKTVTKPSE